MVRGVHRVWLRQRLAEEPLRRLSVVLGREQEVDRLAAAVDGPIQIGPAALTNPTAKYLPWHQAA